MKVFISSIGSRGDVQPILALAVELQALGQQAVICAAPNFQTWVESFGVGFVPIGPDLEKWTAARKAQPAKPMPKPTEEQRRHLATQTVQEQFRVVMEAAQDCDLIVVGGVLQTAGASVAEVLNIPYVYASYCPATLPSPDYPPARIDAVYSQTLSAEENRQLWIENERSFGSMFLEAINAQRVRLGLSPVNNVSRYVSTDHPWLAADPVLAPLGRPMDMQITQTGAWLLNSPKPLPDEVEQFLADGEAPLYFGFGSMGVSEQLGQMTIEAARALGRRAILSRGWANLDLNDEGKDVITIGDVDHAKLFPRVAVIAHHGGAGTTTTAARSGRPQVIVPHNYDQHYWAYRVQTLGVGASGGTTSTLTVEALIAALRESLKPEMNGRAEALASRIELQGARIAVEKLVKAFG